MAKRSLLRLREHVVETPFGCSTSRHASTLTIGGRLKLGELKEIQTKIGREIKKKEKADKAMDKLKRDLMDLSYKKIRDDKILSTGVFEFREKRQQRDGSLKAWVHDFKGMAEIMEAYNAFHGRAIYLTPEGAKESYNVHNAIRIVPLHGDLQLIIGENAPLEYMKAVLLIFY